MQVCLAKLKCYYDQVKIENSRRISSWRDFKYPVQCQNECLYLGITYAFETFDSFNWLRSHFSNKFKVINHPIFIEVLVADGAGLVHMQNHRMHVTCPMPKVLI